MTKLYGVPTLGDYRVHFAWLAKIYLQPRYVHYSVFEQHILMNLTIIAFQNASKFYYDTIRYDAMRCDAMRCDAIRYDTIRYDTIRYDTIRYDTIRYNTIHHSLFPTQNKITYTNNVYPTLGWWERGGRKNNLIVVNPNL